MSDVVALDPVGVIEIYALAPVVFNGSTGEAGLWTGEGPPGTIVGSKVGDEYLDTTSGDLYRLDEGA